MSWISQVLTGLSLLVGNLPQQQTNGGSTLGLLPSPNLPDFLSGPISNGVPWGTAQPGGDPPNTGVTRRYDFTITRGFKSPDGYNKSMLLVNNQYPGPLIEANWGDMIEVKVTNKIDTAMKEGTSLHWHGFLQKQSPWADGVSGVSQCPIAPDASFTYRFQADQYGTTWYHSHYSSQYNDGLVGPIVIYGPHQPGYSHDHDIGPIVVNDLTHENYYEAVVAQYDKPPQVPDIDTNLLNGKGVFDCSLVTDGTACTNNAGWSKFNFTSGKTHRLRFINAGGAANQKITLDNHEFIVLANDFVPVQPYHTKVLTLGVGQRTDVLVRATGRPQDAVWLRADIDDNCLNLTDHNPHALAAVYYEHADTSSKPTTLPAPWESNRCRNDPLNQTVPFYKSTPPPAPATTKELLIELKPNATGFIVFFVNDVSFRTNYNTPILSLAQQGNLTFPEERAVNNFGSNSSVRVIWKNTYAMQHPIHLHGHNFWVLAEGVGEWDGTITNPSNPQRRDVHILQPAFDQPTYIVLEWVQDNPGVWPMHCHTAIHLSIGLYINVLEQPDRIKSDVQLPMIIPQTCKDWDTFSRTGFVDQVDSGL